MDRIWCSVKESSTKWRNWGMKVEEREICKKGRGDHGPLDLEGTVESVSAGFGRLCASLRKCRLEG